MLVGYVEELEVGPARLPTGQYRVTLRHRDEAGKLYSVSVSAKHVVSHNVAASAGRESKGKVFRFPKMELAAFMDGEVLRLCRREEVSRVLHLAKTPGDSSQRDERQLV